VNPTLYTPAEWAEKLQSGSGFAAKVAERPKLFLLGTEQDWA
jgi:hypothetical protein